MKKLVAFFVFFFSFSLVSYAQEQGGNNGTPPPQFIAHEWGTFTTLSGSDGVLLPGLYREEESLPSFVYYFPGFAYGGYIHKGLYLECTDATLKMETPVIYFYSDIARAVSVRVDWPGGAISQWYPNRADGEAISQSNYGTLDFSTPHNGWIVWNANILAKSPNDTVGLSKPYETHTWQSPRATDANIVTDSLGEVEKFIFYRGVGNASFMDGAQNNHYVLRTAFRNNDTLAIDNLTNYNISYALVFERSVDAAGDSTNKVWWSGPINSVQEVLCSSPSVPSITFSNALTQFRDQLVAAGLYMKEASAMIDTWQQSYFGTPGLRVFWIVPRASTDRSLPLTITPAPDNIQRVLVARSEVLTPAFEKQLFNDFSNGTGDYYGDRYYLAYQARYQAMLLASVPQNSIPASGINIYPNPTMGTITLATSESGPVQITLANMLGVEVAHIYSGELGTNEHTFTWSMPQSLPPGMYFVHVAMRNGVVVQKIVKE